MAPPGGRIFLSAAFATTLGVDHLGAAWKVRPPGDFAGRSFSRNCGTPGFTTNFGKCIHRRMSGILTVRIAPELLAKADARAAHLGLERARYVRGLIERDVEDDGPSTRRPFASEDLVGRFRLGGQSAGNQQVRERLQRRSRHEAHR